MLKSALDTWNFSSPTFWKKWTNSCQFKISVFFHRLCFFYGFFGTIVKKYIIIRILKLFYMIFYLGIARSLLYPIPRLERVA